MSQNRPENAPGGHGNGPPREVRRTLREAQALEVTGAAKIVVEAVGLGRGRRVRVRIILADGSEISGARAG